MLLGRMMRPIGPAFVVEVVQQPCQSPQILIRAQLPGIRAKASLHGQRMLSQAIARGVFAEKGPGIVSIWHHCHPLLSRSRPPSRRPSVQKFRYATTPEQESLAWPMFRLGL